MKRAKFVVAVAALLLLTVSSFATETAFMGFDVGTQKMYAVVVGTGASFHARITYSQQNPDGWVGEPDTVASASTEMCVAAPLSPTNPERFTDLPDHATNVITANIAIYDENDAWQYTFAVTDTLLSNVSQGNGFYTYSDGSCEPSYPPLIQIGQSYCAYICHGSYTIPIECEGPGYDPNTLEVSVTNGCDPAETHCNDPDCARIEWSQFRWFKRVFPNCQMFLTMTYCNAAPGCVCIYRSDFYLPVEMTAFDAVAGDGAVALNWASATESETEKYIVTRSDSRDGLFRTVYSTNAAGNSTTPRSYAWTDSEVENGHTYFYKLNVRDAHGGIHIYNVDHHAVVAAATPRVGADGLVPVEFSVKSYPNPFNSQTTFAFSIPVADRVTLKVYDLLGREVATIVDRFMPAATHTVNWNAEGLATGVYMYKLTSGTYSYTNKLLYLK
jgi:hypothetical protein